MSTNNQSTWPAFRSCGIRIDAVPINDAARMIIRGEAKGAIHLCNAYTLSIASRDAGLAEVLDRGSLNLPDGMPLIWTAKRLGLSHMTERVYGPDLMQKVLDLGQNEGTRHFLYGSTFETLAKLQQRISERWPSAKIVGVESPPFGGVSDEELSISVDRAGSLGADVVWVGMGTPQQDLLAGRMAAMGTATYVAIGAAFDFLAGTKKQAPDWVQDHGLEWCYRLMTEPRRLWKRYLVGNTRFVMYSLFGRRCDGA